MTFAAFREFMSTGLAGHLSESEESFHTEKELKRLFMEIDQGHSHSITQNEFVTFFLGSVETSSAGKMVRMVSRGKVQDSPETDAHDAVEVRQSPATEEDAGEVDSSQLRVDIIEEAGEPVRFTSASHVETRTKQSIWLLSAKLLERELIKYGLTHTLHQCRLLSPMGAMRQRCILIAYIPCGTMCCISRQVAA